MERTDGQDNREQYLGTSAKHKWIQYQESLSVDSKQKYLSQASSESTRFYKELEQADKIRELRKLKEDAEYKLQHIKLNYELLQTELSLERNYNNNQALLLNNLRRLNEQREAENQDLMQYGHHLQVEYMESTGKDNIEDTVIGRMIQD